MLETREAGLFCPDGGFYIDPWQPVERAVITHAHGDHARPGSQSYLCASSGEELLRLRVHEGAAIETLPFGERRCIGGVELSFHPAGHILGSAQVRLERRGEVSVVTGDYKLTPDRVSEPFELLRCHRLITESTFALPVFSWSPDEIVLAELSSWWAKNAEQQLTSIVFAYALGKSQRILAALDRSIGPIAVHGAVRRFCPVYQAAGIDLPPLLGGSKEEAPLVRGRGVVIAPPSAQNTPWLQKFKPYRTAIASGWMRIRGNRRRRGVDRGFVLSDHADWGQLLQVVRESSAEEIWVTHGYTAAFARYLSQEGYRTKVLTTAFVGEADNEESV